MEYTIEDIQDLSLNLGLGKGQHVEKRRHAQVARIAQAKDPRPSLQQRYERHLCGFHSLCDLPRCSGARFHVVIDEGKVLEVRDGGKETLPVKKKKKKKIFFFLYMCECM